MDRPARAEDFKGWEAEAGGLVFEEEVGDAEFCGYTWEAMEGGDIVIWELLVEGLDLAVI
jgi:hypothetical protein